MLFQILLLGVLGAIVVALFQIADFLRVLSKRGIDPSSFDDVSATIYGVGTTVAESLNRLSLILDGESKIEILAKDNLQELKKQYYEACLETGKKEEVDELWGKSISAIESLVSATKWTDNLLTKQKIPHRMTYSKMFEGGLTGDDYLPLLQPAKASE